MACVNNSDMEKSESKKNGMVIQMKFKRKKCVQKDN